MVQLVLFYNFKCQVLQGDGVTAPMKKTSGLLGKSDLTSNETRKVAIQTTEPVKTR